MFFFKKTPPIKTFFNILLLTTFVIVFSCKTNDDKIKLYPAILSEVDFPGKYKDIIIEKKEISLDDALLAYNASFIEHKDGYLMVFRLDSNHDGERQAHIGLVLLNEEFKQKSSTIILNTKKEKNIIENAEDPRIFSIKNKIYVVYNDYKLDHIKKGKKSKRVINISQLNTNSDTHLKYKLHRPVELKLDKFNTEKNWTPIIFNDELYFIHSFEPNYIVLKADPNNGSVEVLYEGKQEFKWDYGQIRGGSPAKKFKNGYLGFFHSSKIFRFLDGREKKYYFIGAFTTTGKIPFNINRISSIPYSKKGLYKDLKRKYLFVQSYIIKEGFIHLLCGADDEKIFLLKIKLDQLLNTLEPAI